MGEIISLWIKLKKKVKSLSENMQNEREQIEMNKESKR